MRQQRPSFQPRPQSPRRPAPITTPPCAPPTWPGGTARIDCSNERAVRSPSHSSFFLFVWGRVFVDHYLRRRDLQLVADTGVRADRRGHITGLPQCPGRRQQMEWLTFRRLAFLCGDHPPLSQSIYMGWSRRETALNALATYRLARTSKQRVYCTGLVGLG